MKEDDITVLARELGEACGVQGRRLAIAESCTGGGIAEAITRVAGSSGWFDRGFVTYSDAAKVEMLGVSEETLAAHGAVSEETVREMAVRSLERSAAHATVAVTGIAGPSGGSVEKPVGLVWFAWSVRGGPVVVESRRFGGNRDGVRRQAVIYALRGLLELLRNTAA